MKKSKRIISFILSVTMLLTITAGLSFSAFAEECSGTCGNNVVWSFDTDTGNLTISGNGNMADYLYNDYTPWYSNRYEIETVDIKSGVTSIGDYAFRFCESLSSVTIPNSVTSIGDRAFADCIGLRSVTIPDSVNSIGKHAFSYCDGITNISMPSSETSIGDSAFDGCKSLVSITIPNGITSISAGTFYKCYSLVNLIIPNSVISIDKEAFSGCSRLENIIIPNTVTSIGNDAFKDCSHFLDIKIPNSIISIGDRAFENCTNLSKMMIPDSVISIGDSAFDGCQSLYEVHYAGFEMQWTNISFGYNNSPLHFSDIYYNSKGYHMFRDLNGFESYNEYVLYTSVFNSFIAGSNPPKYTAFLPTTPITRAMFVAILYRMAGNPYDDENPHKTNPFSDVKENAYYYNAACWALDEGITNQTTFKPFDNVTREQTARFLFAYAEAKDMLGDENYKNVNLRTYPDYDSVHSWAVEPLQWANYNDMITGTSQGYINPQGATQRIHATRILYGFGKVCNIGNFE